MSIRDRRNAALKSSISINSIRDAVSSFADGLRKSQKETNEIIDQQQKTNVFKRTLIRNDNKFFGRRRENVLRKQREDEIEASSLQGSTKRQGSIAQKSTRGFLGRILDLVGIVIIGWFTTKLLPILPKLTGLITLVIKLLSVGKTFTDAISTFVVDMQEGISKQFSKIPRKNELEEVQTESLKGLEETSNRVNLLNLDFFKLVFGARKHERFGLTQFGDTDAYTDRGLIIDEEGNMIIPEEEQGSEKDDEKEIEKVKEFISVSTDDILNKNPELKDQQKQDIQDGEEEKTNFIENKIDVSKFVKPQNEGGGNDGNIQNENFEKKADAADKKVSNFFKNVFGFDPKANKKLKEDKEQKERKDVSVIKDAGSKLGLNESVTIPEKLKSVRDKLFGGDDMDEKTKFGPGLFDNKIVVSKSPPNADAFKQDRKRDKIIIVKSDNNNQNSGGGVNSSGGGGGTNVAVNNDKNELKKAMLLNLK